MALYKDVEGYRKLFDEEYKKTRKLISEGETHLDNLAEGFSEASRVLDRIPTADVVPKAMYDDLDTQRAYTINMLGEQLEAEKSNVEELTGKYEDLKLKYADLAKDRDELLSWGGHIRNAEKSEIEKAVAREIFEEISKASADWGCYCISSTKWGYVTQDVSRTLAELKKKYTERG